MLTYIVIIRELRGSIESATHCDIFMHTNETLSVKNIAGGPEVVFILPYVVVRTLVSFMQLL